MGNTARAVLLIAAALPGAPALAQQAAPVPAFVDETASAGIAHRFAGEWEFMVGGGVAVFDCNNDNRPDMLMAGGTMPATLYRNESQVGGALRFAAQVSGAELESVSGAYPVDVDADGNMDVVLLRVGENVVMRGLGGCRFERANEAWGFDGGDAWSTSFAATFERGQQWPTFAVGNYIDRAEEIQPWGHCSDNWLQRPVTGEKRFAPPVALTPSYCTLSMLFTDWNRSGTPSLRVSNDREYYKGGEEQLWHVNPGEPPALYTAKEGWKSLKIWGMGIAANDLNGDGFPEYFLTNMADNRLQVLAETPADGKLKPSYGEAAYPRGVTAHRPYTGEDLRPSTAWHAEFADVNNDGHADLFVAKGNVWEMPDFAMADPNNLLMQQPDGKFAEAGDKAGVASVKAARGGALADFNLDGLLDLVVVNRNDGAELWRNASTNAGSFVSVRLRQEGPNRDAVGAWVEVRCDGHVARQELTVGGGHAGGQIGWRHFGIADTATPEVRIVWSDGTVDEWRTVEPNRFYTVEKGKAPVAWIPG